MLENQILSEKLHWPLFTSGERVLVAVSGGPDSLSLLHVLWTEREAQELGVEAAHLDHGLRGEESAAEAAWVAGWCAERGIPCHVGKADVAGLAKARKRSKQEAARAARYAFLEEVAATIGATKIATGHTQDDQMETVLMNVLRGTGLDGLRGIPARRGPYVRPLLDVSRAEIEDYCAAHGLEPRRDPSNFSPDAYTRNRVRLELLPQLARDYNPAVGAALLRLSGIASRDLDYLAEQAETALAEITRKRDVFGLVLDRPAFAALHPALQRHVLRSAVAGLRGTGEGITYEHMERVCLAVTAAAPPPFLLNLPYPLCTVRVTQKALTLTLANVPVSLAAVSVPLPVPGAATLPGTEWVVQASWEEEAPLSPNSGGAGWGAPFSLTPPELGGGGLSPAPPLSAVGGARGRTLQVWLNADALSGTLTLRNWRQGDRVDPLGMGGRHKKVSDIFTDAKVPPAERPRVPIIADARGIVWIVGYCVAERVKVTPETRRRLFLTAEPTTRLASASHHSP